MLMLRTVAILSFSALLLPGAALASAPQKNKKAKVVHVMHCPIMDTAAKKGIPTRTVKSKSGTYMVHFCCAMCPGQFDKLSAADKEKKIQAALKKGKKAAAASTPKVVEVNTCPIMMGDSSHAGGGSSLVGNYKVNFCCGGCKPKFDSLTAAEKEAKIKAALKS
jgi:hypothetical protein